VKPSSPHKVCIAQLALFTGQPQLAPKLVASLQRSGDVPAATTIETWCSIDYVHADASLTQILALVPDYTKMTVGSFREWLPQTSKYLFHR